MKRRSTILILTLVMVLAFALTGCQSDTADTTPKTEASEAETKTETKDEAKSDEKMTFTIYNVCGMPQFYETVVVEGFKAEYGDKYDVKYETLTHAEVIAKIEAQGLGKGDGNINIVMSGDAGVAAGNLAGVWASLEDRKDDLRYDDLTTIAQKSFEAYDYTVAPVCYFGADPSICYVPTSEAGAELHEIVGDDAAITYEELYTFLTESELDPKFGRGLVTKSGAGDYWTWGVLSHFGEYGPNEEPTQAVAWAGDLYQNAEVRLYSGTGTTFTELTEGSVDVIAQQVSWWAMLHAKGLDENLPESLVEDTKGLENAVVAVMEGEGVTPLASGHNYLIPVNISDEMFEASMEFIKFAAQPEINSGTYAGIGLPAYKTSTADTIADEDVKYLWEQVKQYMPAHNVSADGSLVFPDNAELLISNSAINNKYVKAWQEQVEIYAGQ